MLLTVSVPLKDRFPPIVKLETIKLNPASVMLDCALIVKLEIVTALVSVGMLTAVETIKAESFGATGVPSSQFWLLNQLESSVPSQVRSTPAPPKSQFLLLPALKPLLVSLINRPDRASESRA